MTDLKQLSMKELKQFIADNRTADAVCSAAMEELLSRDLDGVVYPPDMTAEAMEQILQQKLTQLSGAES
jgi:hypothetical protein